MQSIVDGLGRHSDVEAAIVGASLIESSLGALIESTFRKLSQEDKNDLFRNAGPLGSTWSRTRLAYAMKLISRNVRNEIDKIATIRNYFAHALYTKSFFDPDIEEKCRNLTLFDKLEKETDEFFPDRHVNPHFTPNADLLVLDGNNYIISRIAKVTSDPPCASKDRFLNSSQLIWCLLSASTLERQYKRDQETTSPDTHEP